MDLVIRKLELRSALTQAEKAAVRATFAVKREFETGHDLLKMGEKPAFVGALLDGMLCRYKPLGDGHRQIVSLSLAGDIFDLHSFTTAVMDHCVGTLTRSTVATASHADIEAMIEAYPRLGMLLWRDAVVEGAVFREWIVNCGRRSAYQRIAHLFCETFVRSDEVGLAKAHTCALPLTQVDLADSTGLSVVHVNRVLQRLRAEKLIAFHSGRLAILDWERLAAAGGFDSTYLHARANLVSRRGFAFRAPVSFPNAAHRQATTCEAGDVFG